MTDYIIPKLPEPIPFGHCHCGCGQKTKISTETSRKNKQVKGEPLLYLKSTHANRNGTPEHAIWRYCTPGDPRECWIWQGYEDEHGYGIACYGAGRIPAHRLSYTIHVGSIPEGLVICHKCDNPPCINPNHLFLGTYLDNVQDMRQKGRARDARGELAGNVKTTELAVIHIRELANQGMRYTDIAKIYTDLTPHHISLIARRICWKHVT